ncbi:hypothetical protein [Kutzneria sp. NPDC052558]|uniref:hypothetical protein n=1 Tax=Kutzneria sp. NPDC052558 TaxID=3364121 RepID=UPI0037C9D885
MSLSATPIGSFTLTRAIGREANPGNTLPYRRTTPDDWWGSPPGPLYNTHQRCAGGCAFEHRRRQPQRTRRRILGGVINKYRRAA